MTREHGFTLLETTVAIALVSFTMLAATAAVAHAVRANAGIAEREALADDARNVLADLRAATAYDASALARLNGRHYTASLVRDGRTYAVTVDVGAVAGAGATGVATVTVADGVGASATERQSLLAEAPAPGSVLDAPSPFPDVRQP